MPIANPFQSFDLPVSPSVDLPVLKERFTLLTSQFHPDKFQSAPEPERLAAEARFLELNKNYQTLQDPKLRLLYLYESATGNKPSDIQRIPPGTMDLFVEIGQTCRDIDDFLQRHAAATGALARASLASESLQRQETLQNLKQRVQSWGDDLDKKIQELGQNWNPQNVSKAQVTELEVNYRKLSYLARWKQQMEERELALYDVL